MKISSFDLNLLVILNAIYTEGSLTKAAQVVGITQPAVSNALSRLRENFNDDLFIRTGSGMVPTQKTENIIKDIQQAIALMQNSINEPNSFIPAETTRNFKLHLGDVSETRILPYLTKIIDMEAPKISIGSYNFPRKDQVHALATNNLDFVVDPIIPQSEEINSCKVFEDHFVLAHRDGHPLTKKKKITLEDIIEQKHIQISSRKRGLHLMDIELEKVGYKREIALRCQHFLIAPKIITSTDLVLFATHSFAVSHNLKFIEIPLEEVPKMEYFLFWHKSDEGDGGHEWMKDNIIQAYKKAMK